VYFFRPSESEKASTSRLIPLNEARTKTPPHIFPLLLQLLPLRGKAKGCHPMGLRGERNTRSGSVCVQAGHPYLQRSSGQEQAILRRELANRHAEQGRFVLQPVPPRRGKISAGWVHHRTAGGGDIRKREKQHDSLGTTLKRCRESRLRSVDVHGRDRF